MMETKTGLALLHVLRAMEDMPNAVVVIDNLEVPEARVAAHIDRLVDIAPLVTMPSPTPIRNLPLDSGLWKPEPYLRKGRERNGKRKRNPERWK